VEVICQEADDARSDVSYSSAFGWLLYLTKHGYSSSARRLSRSQNVLKTWFDVADIANHDDRRLRSDCYSSRQRLIRGSPACQSHEQRVGIAA
jgi:hypothetical protein